MDKILPVLFDGPYLKYAAFRMGLCLRPLQTRIKAKLLVQHFWIGGTCRYCSNFLIIRCCL